MVSKSQTSLEWHVEVQIHNIYFELMIQAQANFQVVSTYFQRVSRNFLEISGAAKKLKKCKFGRIFWDLYPLTNYLVVS